MNKYIAGAVLSLGLLVSPVFASAASLTSAQIQSILSLLSAFGADQTTVANVTTALRGGTPATVNKAYCHTFSTDLTVGKDGDEVFALNRVLTLAGIERPSTSSTFDENTAADVVAFQARYGIRQTGYVGPITRAKLNALYGCPPGEIEPVPTFPVDPPMTTTMLTPTCSYTSNSTGKSDGIAFNSNIARTAETCKTLCTMVRNEKYGVSDSGTCIFTNENGVGQSVMSVSASTPAPVTPTMTITSPLGGEIWQVGQTKQITWNSTGLPANSPVDIELQDIRYFGDSADAKGLIARTTNTGSFSWTIPQMLSQYMSLGAGKVYKVWVRNFYGKAIGAYESGSTSTFSIIPQTGVSSSVAPVITSLSPASGAIGSRFTIRGTGFTPTGNKVKFGDLGAEARLDVDISSDGTSLYFYVPQSNYYSCWDEKIRCLIAERITPPGTYMVSVINSNGKSNELPFVVTP